MFHITAAMAQYERSLIQERVRAGLRNARAKGRQIGRRRAAFDVNQARFLIAAGHSLACRLSALQTFFHRYQSPVLSWVRPASGRGL